MKSEYRENRDINKKILKKILNVFKHVFYVYFFHILETSGLKDTTQVENLQDQALAMLRNHIESRYLFRNKLFKKNTAYNDLPCDPKTGANVFVMLLLLRGHLC